MLLVSSWFAVSQTIIPEAQEHFLTPTARRHSYLFGGLGLIRHISDYGFRTDAAYLNNPTYLVARAMAGLSQVRTTRRTYRRLLLAAAAVIILMASTVTGLAYGISTAKHHGLIDRSNPAAIGLTAPPTPTNGAVGFAFSHRTKTPSRLC